MVMIVRLVVAVLMLLGSLLAGTTTASAATPAPKPPCPSPCLDADGDSFTGGGTRSSGGSGGSGGSDKPVRTGAGPRPAVITQKTYVPTCSGNTAYNNGLLCGAAVESCPIEGEVQFWVFTRQFNVVTGTEVTPYMRVDNPPSVCLGPDDPAVDPAVAIPAVVQRDFQRVVVLKGAADVTPKPDTLVNVVTKFRTDAPGSYEIPLSILGQSVVITAKAEKYTWHFGDGRTAASTAPGGYAEHTYRKALTEQAHVVITWSGTFTINGGASQAISGTVSTTGNPVDVNVREARSELVRD